MEGVSCTWRWWPVLVQFHATLSRMPGGQQNSVGKSFIVVSSPLLSYECVGWLEVSIWTKNSPATALQHRSSTDQTVGLRLTHDVLWYSIGTVWELLALVNTSPCSTRYGVGRVDSSSQPSDSEKKSKPKRCVCIFTTC